MFVRDEKDDDNSDEKPDTSKETDNSEEDDDSTEESDSKDSEKKNVKKKESDEDDSEEEDIAKKYFTDPNSVPPELRKSFKKMQGIFTRKMQQFSQGVEKANAFDQLILDPDFRKFMEIKRKGGKLTTSNSNDDNDDDEDDDRPLTRKELKSMLSSEVNKAYAPFREREEKAVMTSHAEAFKKANPDWKLYKDDIVSIMSEHPTLSYQQAYDLASKEEREEDDEDDVVEKKKKANVSKPSKTGAKDVPEKKGKMTVKDAFKLAQKKLGLLK